MSKIVNVKDEDFKKEVLDSKLPVLVVFWAEWCGPCKVVSPVVEDAAIRYEDSVKVVKINIDDEQRTPPKYGIRGIPSFLFLGADGGEVLDKQIGAVDSPQLSNFIESNL